MKRSRAKGRARSTRVTPPLLHLSSLASGVMEACWLTALVCVPTYFNLYSERSFDADKLALLKVLAVVLAAAWLVRSLGGETEDAASGSRGGSESLALNPRGNWLVTLGPVLAVLASVVLSTLLSVSPMRSWHGSYFRQQGVQALLAYGVMASAVFVFVRSAVQWRRIRLAVILGTIPACAYAVAQKLTVDPLAVGLERIRTPSTFGNPIFLGGYLALAVFVTIHGLADSRPGDRAGRTGSAGPRLALALILALQLTGLLLSQSRGPVLGVLAGLAVLLLAWSLRGRAAEPLPGARGWWQRRSWTVVLVSVLLGGTALASLAFPGSPLAGLRNLPTVGRLATALDPASRSSRVRILTWQGVADLATAPPLLGPDGEKDVLGGLRRWFGYGPDTFDLAYNRVFVEQLGTLEQRNSVPDRAHNELFDIFVHTGLTGLAAWLALLVTALAGGAAWAVTGCRDPGSGTWFFVASAGGCAGGAAAALVTHRPEFAGLLASVGLLVGIWTAMLIAGLRRPRGAAGRSLPAALVPALLAALVCHVAEVAVGIPMTGSRLLFFMLLAVLAAGTLGRWRNDLAASSGAEHHPDGGPQDREHQVAALTTGIGLAAIVYALLLSKPLGVGPPSRDSLWEFIAVSSLGAWGVVLVLVLSAGFSALAVWSHSCPHPLRRPQVLSVGMLGLLPPFAAGTAKLHWMAATARLQRTGAAPDEVMEQVAGHPRLFLMLVLVLVGVFAAMLSRNQADADSTTARRPVRILVSTLMLAALVGIPALAAGSHVLKPIRADIFLKQGLRVVGQGLPTPALMLFRRAHALAPDEVAPLRGIGLATVTAVRSAERTARPGLVAEGRTALERAIRLQPLDPDHHVNLGRLLAATGELEPDPGTRRLSLEQAAAAYRTGIALRPGSVLFRTEYAGVLGRLGQLEETVRELEGVLAVDPGYDVAANYLARIEHNRAVNNLLRGRHDLAEMHMDRAVRILRALLAAGPKPAADTVASGGAASRQGEVGARGTGAAGSPSQPSPEPEDMKALLHLAREEPDLAVATAAQSVRTAGPAELARARAAFDLVQRRVTQTREPGGAPGTVR